MLLLPERHRADRSPDAGTMDATDASSPRSVICCAISVKSLVRPPKQPAQTVARNLLELRLGMGICCTTSASEELLEAAVLDLQSQTRCESKRRESEKKPVYFPNTPYICSRIEGWEHFVRAFRAQIPSAVCYCFLFDSFWEEFCRLYLFYYWYLVDFIVILLAQGRCRPACPRRDGFRSPAAPSRS